MKNTDKAKVAHGQKSVKNVAQPHESRPNWAIAYPPRNKREDWQADFAGVIRLAESGKLFWVNVWEHPGGLSQPRHFGLSIKAKGSTEKPVRGLLTTTADHPERYTGSLQLSDGTRYIVTLWEDDQPAQLLSVHFERSVEP
jgi:hypothetical protein